MSRGYPYAANIAASDTNTLSPVTEAIYVGVTGNVNVRMAKTQANAFFQSVPAGTVLRVRVDRVWATGTSASGISVMWGT